MILAIFLQFGLHLKFVGFSDQHFFKANQWQRITVFVVSLKAPYTIFLFSMCLLLLLVIYFLFLSKETRKGQAFATVDAFLSQEPNDILGVSPVQQPQASNYYSRQKDEISMGSNPIGDKRYEYAPNSKEDRHQEHKITCIGEYEKLCHTWYFTHLQDPVLADPVEYQALKEYKSNNDRLELAKEGCVHNVAEYEYIRFCNAELWPFVQLVYLSHQSLVLNFCGVERFVVSCFDEVCPETLYLQTQPYQKGQRVQRFHQNCYK